MSSKTLGQKGGEDISLEGHLLGHLEQERGGGDVVFTYSRNADKSCGNQLLRIV